MKRFLVALAALLALAGCGSPSQTPVAPVDSTFRTAYSEMYAYEFDATPTEETLRIGDEFAHYVCKSFAQGSTQNDVTEEIFAATQDPREQVVYLMALISGTLVYCPEYEDN